MKNPQAKLWFFLLSVALLLWFLYPHKLFLGMMYEDAADMRRAERYYQEYLSEHPLNKKAILRLARLYNRMGQSEAALGLLQKLYAKRLRDFAVAEEYLAQIELMHDEKRLYQEQLAVARAFAGHRYSRYRLKVLHMLELAWAYASWHQATDDAYTILTELVRLSPDPASYSDQLLLYDKGFKRTEVVLSTLRKRALEKPRDMDVREDLVRILYATGNLSAALLEIAQALPLTQHPAEFLRLRIDIYQEQKKFKEALADVDIMLADTQQLALRDDWLRTRADLLENMGQKDQALTIYQDLCQRQGDKSAACIAAIWMLSDLKRTDVMLEALESWLNTHPEDESMLRLRAETYLYEKKDVTRLSVYLAYLAKNRQADFAVDVGYLLIEKKLKAQALQWFRERLADFSDRRITEALAELYIEAKKYPEAIVLLRSLWPMDFNTRLKLAQVYELARDTQKALAQYQVLISEKPKDTELLLAAASLATAQGELKLAQAYYERVAGLAARNPDTLMLAGREMLFLGNPRQALVYLRRATDQDTQHAAAWFWAAEAYRSDGKIKDAQYSSLQVKKILQDRSRLSPDQHRMLLKSRARLKLGAVEMSDFEKAIRDNPVYLDLRTDYLDVLLDAQRHRLASQQIENFARDFPRESERLKPYRVRLCFLTQDWKQAVSLLREILQVNPNQWSYRRDLAQAFGESGQWQESLREYESVQQGGSIDVSQPLRLMHQKYDSRIMPVFQYQDLGTDTTLRWWAGYRHFLNNHWEIDGQARVGIFHTGLGFDGTAGGMDAWIHYHAPPRWSLGVGAAVMGSEARFTVAPGIRGRYDIPGKGFLQLEYVFRDLRVDVPQAVAEGDLQDRAIFSVEYSLYDRLILDGEYRFDRDVLSSGDLAYTHTIKPALAVILWRRPFVTVGYQYAFVDVEDRGAFLTRLPLVPRLNAHYLTLFYSQDFARDIHFEAGFFAGEDVARDLHLFEGDLFGARARFDWRMTNSLDFFASYEFGRETISRVSGESHSAEIGAVIHWK